MFSDINISQGSVATPSICDGIFSYIFIANFLLSVLFFFALEHSTVLLFYEHILFCEK